MVVPFKMNLVLIFLYKKMLKDFKTLEKVKHSLGQTLPIVIDGEHIIKDDTFDSINPAEYI